MSVGLKVENAASLTDYFQALTALSLLLHEPPVSAMSVVPVGRADWQFCPKTFRQLSTRFGRSDAEGANVGLPRNGHSQV
ncbi:hypothetical protein [Allopontixanthobacter sp.]|uniref:hypothetical protein n=1 Tax=Allopontixanthobacter sp. TaxID=2906452 RepID=UPI002ABAFEB2|nr:hypothetical protein [Allopontixanthobacter sp.]MDZ4306725.1 hypothetical protein [Allopontixanthobacter sp.]